jgi:hypothetical protein
MDELVCHSYLGNSYRGDFGSPGGLGQRSGGHGIGRRQARIPDAVLWVRDDPFLHLHLSNRPLDEMAGAACLSITGKQNDCCANVRIHDCHSRPT